MDLRYIYDLQLKDEEVLCVYRKDKSYAKKYRRLIKNFSKDYLKVDNPDSLSEYENSANHYIDLKKYSVSDYTDEDFEVFNTLIDLTEDIRKERIFRTHLNFYEAHDLLMSCTKFFIEFFKAHKYKVIVVQSPDNYVGHTMVRVAEHLGIKVIGICLFFVSGLVRINIFGEHNILRTPDKNEVLDLYKRLEAKEKFKVTIELKKFPIYKELVRQYLVYKAKYLIHYIGYHKIMGKLEYDYIGTPAFTYPDSIAKLFIGKYFEKNTSNISNLDKTRSVYIPLHVFPESTVEHWVDSAKISPYYPSLFESIQKLSSKGFNIIIKEHPGFIFKRDKSIYKKIKSIKNTYLIQPFVSSYEVLKCVDYVVVWTGTSGIEAIIQDKKVLIASENYYSNGELERIDNIENSKIFTYDQKLALIRRVLENCIPLND